jgi:diguanylate cyclase (GGDEF)-like protein
MNGLLRATAPFAVPAALLAVAFALVFYNGSLPPSLAGLKVYGPYIAFALGAGLAAAFNRGRAFLALVVLAGTYGAQQAWLLQPLDTPVARAVFGGLTVFVPLNLALLAILPERGAFNRHGGLRLAVVALQAAFVAWAASQPAAIDWAYTRLIDPPPFSIGLIPQPGTAVIGLALLVSIAATAVTRSATHAALTGAIIAFAVAIHAPAMSLGFAIFISMAQLMVTLAVLQDTFRMAFRDELTGLPSRRALNERLAGLGKRYVIAMLDVDHFKKFNDTHGHDLGDQVLKMVAAHIGGVGGGGKAYRYGGEEFTVVFPGEDIEDALPHLEDLRAEIEAYRLALRASDRPKKAKGGKRQRGGWRGKDSVSVTISIGVAERGGRLATPQAVIEAADRALYRAKEKGRNRVSR